MRRLAFLMVLLAGILSACAPKHKVTGNLSDVQSGWLLCVYTSDGESGAMGIDTVYVENGKFFYDPSVDEPGVLMIVEQNRFIDNIVLFMAPGEHAVLNGSLDDYEVSGSAFYKDWGKFHNMIEDNENARKDLLRTIPEEEDPDYDMAEFSRKDRENKDQWEEVAISFIQANPGSDVSAYLAHELNKVEDFAVADQVISDKVKKGPLGYLIEKKADYFDGEALRQESMKTIYEGAQAPDFTLKTSTGETFTLSDYRGRYVMLDFWGTWCHWCVEGLPTVKEIAHTYKDKLTVVSVDTRDSQKAWRDGIEKYGMDWVQVYNGSSDAIDSKYAVQGFPGFYLIDPEGVIKMIAFGEPAHFVEKIGELIK